MQTFNFIYTNEQELKDFISNNNISNSNSILIQIFSGIINKEILQNLVTKIYTLLPQAKIIGATTDGEIIDDNVLTKSIVIAFSTFINTQINSYYIDNKELSHFTLGEELIKNIIVPDSKLAILFATGLSINAEEFLKGIGSISNIPIAGGLAGDNANFKQTYIIHNNKVLEYGAVGVSLNNNNLYISQDYALDWTPIGKTFTIDEVKDNIVYSIDGVSPYELYKKYLGDDIANRLPQTGIEFPLLIQKDNKTIARAVLGKKDNGALKFAGNIPPKSKVRFGIGNIEQILQRSTSLANKFVQIPTESIFVYSCMARRRFLRSDAQIDTKNLSKITSVSGFFTYGEFQTVNNKNELLNETLTIVSLSETQSKSNNNIEYDKEVYDEQHLASFRALSHIINETTKELIELNENLEEKIEEETLKNLQYQFKMYEQAKLASMGEMIANIAHQWRQPLNVISTLASGVRLNIKMGHLEEDDIIKKMNKITTSTQYLSSVIDTFRNYIKEKKIAKVVIFQDRINLAIKIIDTVLKDNNIKLINNINYDNPIKIKIQVGELVEVVINIINNAKDVLKERNIKNPWIKFDLNTTDDKLYFGIEDNAGGIKANLLDKIFEPYFTTKHQSQGTGLGLYMSKQIVTQSLHGNLSIINTKNGAKFTIELPIYI